MSTPSESLPPTASPRRSQAAGIATAVMVLLVCGFYLWTASSNLNPFTWQGRANDYYNKLAHGFAQGHLYMDVARVGRAPTPDPQGLGGMPYLNDASFYQGKYYLYFGPTPVLTVFLPYHLLTGHDLSDNFVAALFACAGFLVSLGLIAAVRRRHFPQSTPWLLPLFAGLLGLGNGCAVMLRHPMFYEVAIACAYFCQALVLLALFRALHAPAGRGRLAWLALAGLAAGLGVGSRANLVLAAPAAVGLALLWLWWRREDRSSLFPGAVRAMALAGLGPLAACGAGLMAYNYLRFGDVLEFGVKYMFSFKTVFGPQFLLHNLKLYYFSFPEFSWYFPFISPVREVFRPEGYGGIEQVHGQIWSTAWFLPLVGGAVFCWRRRSSAWAPLAVFFGCGLWLYLANLLLLLCLGGRASRYLVDFQPTFLLLGAIGLLAAGGGVSPLPGWRRLVRPAAVLAVAVLGWHNVMASCQLYELFRYSNRTAYETLATTLNAPSHWLGPWLEPRQGPIRMQATFPRGLSGRLEPLVVTGASEYSDTLLVHYLDEGNVRFVLQHHGYGAVVGPSVRVGVNEAHAVEVEMGSLYPPAEHPLFARFSPGETRYIKRLVRVTVDGKVAFDARRLLYDASPGAVYLGESPFRNAPGIGGTFSGRISNVTRAGLAGLKAEKIQMAEGAVAMRVVFPGFADRNPEPLLTTGLPGTGDLVYVKYVDERHVCFGFDHWGVGGPVSEPVELDPAVPHELEISLGSLFSPEAIDRLARISPLRAEQAKNLVRVKVDGREVLNQAVAFYPTALETVQVGANDIGLSSAGTVFNGDIIQLRRLPLDEPAPPGPVDRLQLRVRFPSGRAGQTEPLLTTGAPARADVVAVTYVDDGHVRFSLDHWGAPLRSSPLVPLDYGRPHLVDLELASLPAPAPGATRAERATASAGPGAPFRLWLDGKVVFETTSDFFPAGPDEIHVGSNPVGATTSQAGFSGIIDRIEPAIARDYGPMRFAMTLPFYSGSRTEPLVVSGITGKADALGITYVDPTHIRLFWDHWGLGGPTSDLISIEPGRTYALEVDMGSFYPEGATALSRILSGAQLAQRRQRLRVSLDGKEVFAARGDFHPSRPADIHIGLNRVGIDRIEKIFTGTLEGGYRPGPTP
jgi:hypothetical protein